jgi:hypothetical protein
MNRKASVFLLMNAAINYHRRWLVAAKMQRQLHLVAAIK